MKLKHLLICLPTLSCGAPDGGSSALEGPWRDDAGELVVRIDGSPEEDGIFASATQHDEFCGDNPESEWCATVGSTQQAWRSAEYYGLDPQTGSQSHNCYSRSGTGCLFPEQLNFKLHVDSSNCLSNTVPLLQAQAIFDSAVDGLLAWNGVGGAVVVRSTAGGAQFVSVVCTDIPGTVQARDITNGNQHIQLGDLPVGPHGQNPTSARQYDGSTIQIDVQQIYNVYTSPNGCNRPSPTTSELRAYAKYLGMHEMGHSVGFAHFTGTNLMNPNARCAPGSISPTSDRQFGDALRIYSGTNSAATISDVNLEDLGQQ